MIQTIHTAFATGADVKGRIVGDYLVASSRRIASELRAHLPEARIEVVYPAVDTRIVAPRPRDDDWLQSIGVPPQSPFALYAGNYTARLGVIEVVDIFEDLARGDRNLHLVMANRIHPSRPGKAERRMKAEVVSRIAKAGLDTRVTLLETMTDFFTLLSQAQLFLFPALSLRERKMDVPLVLLEAMAMGIPVGAYSIDPLDELPIREAGFLVPPEARTSFVERALEILSDENMRIELGRRGRSAVQRLFSPAEQASILRAIYTEATRVD